MAIIQHIFKFIELNYKQSLVRATIRRYLQTVSKNRFLKHSYLGHTYVEEKIKQFNRELKTAMFLVGAENIEQLQQKKVIITGKTREVLEQLEIDTKKFARRI